VSCSLFEHLPSLAAGVASAPHVLLALDFDGTLTPIVGDPAHARLDPETQEVLRTLADRAHLSVAVISGRALDDLKSRVGMDRLIYAGNHGMDILGPGLRFVEAAALAQQQDLGQLAQTLAGRLQHIAGTIVEDKGLTLSIHYRLVTPAQVSDVYRIVEAARACCTNRYAVTHGVKVLEIRPTTDWNKGKAVSWIREKFGKKEVLVIYLGDDQTDEDAFRAEHEGITIKVGDPANTCARYYVDSPAEVLTFLRWLERVSQNGD